MRLEGFINLLFILYCVTAGIFLIVAPWSPLWERSLLRAPTGTTVQLLSHSTARAITSGFGMVHLVWALNDLEGLFLLMGPRSRPGDVSG